MNTKEHVTLLGALYIAFNVGGLVAAAIVLVAVTGGGFLSGDPEAIWITSAVGISVASLLFVLSTPGIIAGIGLLKRKPWARILTLILGCINLLCIPIGTILGVYTIWLLLQEGTVQYFHSGQKPG